MMSKFEITLSNLLKARFPYLYIPTWEEERLIQTLFSIAQNPDLVNTTRKVITWSITDGIQPHRKAKETRSPWDILEFIEKTKTPSLFVLKDFHVYFGASGRQTDEQIIRKIRDLFHLIKNDYHPKNVIFVSPTMVIPHDLQKEITIVDFDLPSYEEIRHFLDEMIRVNCENGHIEIQLSYEEKEQLAKAALGLTLQEAENAFARAIVEGGALNQLSIDAIIEEKKQVVKKTGILEFIQTDIGIDDVGGLDNLKRWLKKRNKAWYDSAKLYGLPAPKGILITGVPGCGKSLIAKAISAMWKLPLLKLDIGKVFAGIVGSSEENMRQVIKTAEAIAPSILWIDEIEKGFSQTGTGDGGTARRVFASFLTWLQEKTKPVFVVATANQIKTLPPELLRKGRFDEIFFVDLPTKEERKTIFRIHLKKRLVSPQAKGDFEINEELLETLSELTEGFIGAEIEEVVISALFEAFSEDRAITLEDLVQAIQNTVPLSVTQGEQIKEIREWATLRAVAATKRDPLKNEVLKSQLSQNLSSFSSGRKVSY